MIYFNKELVALAENIKNFKSTNDDLKAYEDICELENMIKRLNSGEMCLQDKVEQLDQRINREYPLINKLSYVAESISQNQFLPRISTLTNNTTERNINILMFDRYGVLADVLIKHKKISNLKEFIDRVE